MRTVPNLIWTCGAALAVVTIATIAEPTAGAAPAAPALASSSAARDDDGDRNNGRKVFLRENCYICHGGRAGGGMCPSLREDPPDESDVRHAVEDGTESGMPSYEGRVSRKEIEDLAAYFESLRSAREPIFTHWWEPGVPSR
jgi:mono/diheme cytochrome c family protein